MSRKKKGGKKKPSGQYVIFFRSLFHSKEWKGLSAPARTFYECLKARYAGYNNREIQLPYSAMRGIDGCSSKATVAKAIKELETKGWIKVTQRGGLYRFSNLYELTFKHDHYDGPNANKDKRGKR